MRCVCATVPDCITERVLCGTLQTRCGRRALALTSSVHGQGNGTVFGFTV
jgi:hypothetical protein